MRVYKYNIPLGITSEVSVYPSTDDELRVFVKAQNIGVVSEYFWVVPDQREAHE